MASGKKAWKWIQENGDRWGTVVVTSGLTVGQLESACGNGALTAAQRHCKRIGEAFPYATYLVSVDNEQRQRPRLPGEEQPSDSIAMYYPCIA